MSTSQHTKFAEIMAVCGITRNATNTMGGKNVSHFRHVRKIVKSDYLLHVRLSVRPSAWNNSAPNGQTLMKLNI